MARKFDPSKHPRDKNGRFTKSRTVKASAKDKAAARQVAEGFKPAKTGTGAQSRRAYLQKVGGGASLDGLTDANRSLRAGKTSPAAAELDRAMVALPDDVLLSRRVPRAAFGDTDPAGLAGMKVRDAGFAPAQLGTVQSADGQVRMHIAVPAGTRAAVNPDTGEVVLDRDTEMVVARVEQVGGGHDMWLTVLPKAEMKAQPGPDALGEPETPEVDADQPDAELRADLMKLKVPELRELMATRGLRPGRMRKSQMVDALVADETGDEPKSDSKPKADITPAPVEAPAETTTPPADPAGYPPARQAPEAGPSEISEEAAPTEANPDPSAPVAAGDLPLGAGNLADLVRNMQTAVPSTADKDLINAFVIDRLRFDDPASGISAVPSGASVRAGKITVSFALNDRDGNKIGKSSRVFTLGPNGEPTMVNNRLELDPSVQGAGFAARFAARNEQFAVAQGIDRVSLTANIDVGGYAWSRAGFDFADIDSARRIADHADRLIATRGPDGDWSDEIVGQFRQLADRTRAATDRDGTPTPLEWSMVGWTPRSGRGRAAMWPGKQMMLGSEWEGEKSLRPATPDMPAPTPAVRVADPRPFDERVKAASVTRKALDAAPLSLLPRSRNDPTLTPERRRLVRDVYLGEASDVSQALKNGGPVSEFTGSRIGTVDEVMAGSPLASDVMLHRSAPTAWDVFGDAAGGNLTGVEWIEPDFRTATTIAPPDNELGLQMRILAPQGMGAVAVSAGSSSELLLDRGHRLRVVKDHGRQRNGPRIVDVEILPKDGSETDPFTVVETQVTSPENPISDQVRATLPDSPFGRGVASGIASSQNITEGEVGDTRLVTFTDGSRGIQKIARRVFSASTPKDLTDGEDLASKVGRAIGAPVPEVVRTNEHEVFMDFVPDAKPGMAVLNRFKVMERAAKFEEIIDSRDGRLLGVLDLIVGNSDRHAGNWLVSGDGSITGIDHGLVWGRHQTEVADVRATDPRFESPFAERFFREFGGDTGSRGWQPNDLSQADVAWMREQVAALRPEFEALGRSAWLDYSLARLDQLGEYARGGEDRVRP